MDRDLIENYLVKSGMDVAQADTLSRILADMESRLATKEDLAALEARLTWRMFAIVALVNTLLASAFALIGS